MAPTKATKILVDTLWLKKHLDDPKLRIVDCSSPDAYWQVFIPGTVKIADNRLKDPNNPNAMVTPAQFSEVLEQLGISRTTQVVAYDGAGGMQYFGVYASRLWWVLNCYGYSQVSVLDGGWRKWLYETILTGEVRPLIKPVRPAPELQKGLIASYGDVKAASNKRGTVIWDVRSRLRYSGKGLKASGVRGHIPGAVNLDWRDLLRNDRYHTFREEKELRELLDGAGIRKAATVIVYSEDGIESTLGCLVLKKLGYEKVQNYEGGWAEWSGKGLPVEG